MHEVQPRGTSFVGELPDGWIIAPMSEVCTKVTDGTHGTPETIESGRPYITAIHVKGGKIDFQNCLYLSETDHREIFNRCNPVPGDLAVVNIGAGVGECGFVDVSFEFSMKNVALLKPDPAKLAPRFLFNIHQFRKDRIAHAVKSGGAQPFLSLRDLRKLPVLVPPLPEQRKIAEILSTWDRAIETTEALLATARTQKRALMQSLLTGKRRFPEFQGQEWREVRLDQLATIKKGQQKSKATLSDVGDFPVINGGVVPSGYTDEWNSEAGTITISEGGNSCGFVNLIDRRFWSGGHCYTLADLRVRKDFLFHSLKFQETKIMSLRVGSGLPNIQKKAVSGVQVGVPSEAEQRRIEEVLNAGLNEENILVADIEKLRTEKKALMQQLLTGKRRVVV